MNRDRYNWRRNGLTCSKIDNTKYFVFNLLIFIFAHKTYSNYNLMDEIIENVLVRFN